MAAFVRTRLTMPAIRSADLSAEALSEGGSKTRCRSARSAGEKPGVDTKPTPNARSTLADQNRLFADPAPSHAETGYWEGPPTNHCFNLEDDKAINEGYDFTRLFPPVGLFPA